MTNRTLICLQVLALLINCLFYYELKYYGSTIMNTDKLKKLIESNLPDTMALVRSGDDVHFEVVIVSKSFSGIKSRVERQKMVYAIISEHISSGELHAIAMKAYTFEEWEMERD